MKHKPVWNVYKESFNDKEIVIFNVFNHHNFFEKCKLEIRKYKKDKDVARLEKEIKSWAMYYFWSKCEYEILLSSWIRPERFETKKIDIYDQLCLNWDSFFKYILDNQSDFTRRKT